MNVPLSQALKKPRMAGGVFLPRNGVEEFRNDLVLMGFSFGNTTGTRVLAILPEGWSKIEPGQSRAIWGSLLDRKGRERARILSAHLVRWVSPFNLVARESGGLRFMVVLDPEGNEVTTTEGHPLRGATEALEREAHGLLEPLYPEHEKKHFLYWSE